MKPYRIERVCSELRQIVSEAISNKLQDPRIAPLTSVTRVEVSGDLEHAKVYISVFGERSDQKRTMAALHHAQGYIQKLVARGLTIRQCPHLQFQLDESIKRTGEVMQIINDSMTEIEQDEARRQEPLEEESSSTEGAAE